MTDFGGSGLGGTIAECELNLPEKSVSGSTTLTSSDLNELGCTSSTVSSSGVSSAKSDFSKRRSSLAPSQHQYHVRSGSLMSIFRRSRSAQPRSPRMPLDTMRSKSTATTTDYGRSKRAAHGARGFRPRSSSSRILVDIVRSFAGGFSTCSRRRNCDDGPRFKGSNSCSNSDAMSSNSMNQYPNSQGRRKSHDGSQDGTNGSDSTSTGYVSDSSNEKHYPKNNHKINKNPPSSKSVARPVSTVSTISKVVDDAKIATVWTEQLKEVTNRVARQTEIDTGQVKTTSPIITSTNKETENPEEDVVPTTSSNRDTTSSERNNSYTGFCYVASSVSDEEITGTEDSLYTSATEESSDYETNETSSYEDETDEKEIKGLHKRQSLQMIKEEEEEESQNARKVRRRKSTLKRLKRKLNEDIEKLQPHFDENALKAGMKSTLASLKAKEEDNVSRTGSLKDMILQFETAVAALEINDINSNDAETAKDAKSPLQGVKAIAQKIQEQAMLECPDVELMPPSQMLKLQQKVEQALIQEPDKDLSQPIPLSRRSESKVAQIARQLAEAERQRVKLEKAAAKKGLHTPKDIAKKESSTSFINELLEMARAESSDKLNEPSKAEEAPDFKQSLLAARKKITQREDEVRKSQASQKRTTPTAAIQSSQSASSIGSESNVSESGVSAGPNANEEIDPFVKEVLRSKTVPEPVKQKIRIECWSLFNDPRTPKGVKQCILATMLSKVQNE